MNRQKSNDSLRKSHIKDRHFRRISNIVIHQASRLGNGISVTQYIVRCAGYVRGYENHYSITPYKTKTWELTLLPVPRSKALAMPIRQKRATPKAHVYVHAKIQYALYT